jgi:osmotically-inducible protein OsmY
LVCASLPAAVLGASQEGAVRATRGVSCAAPLQAQSSAPEQRPERGIGTAYDRDPELARRVAAVLRTEAKLADTSIWVVARRQSVTLKGCVRMPEQRQLAEGLARRTMGVLNVWNETRVVAGAIRPTPIEIE